MHTRTHTHTHHLLSCGASCPDCVNPLCPPHISLHPSTSTPLWWRHTHARAHTHTHLLLSIIIIVSAGEESALLFVITGVWSEREEFLRREREEDGWLEKGEKRKTRSEKKAHQRVCDILVTFYRNCCSTPSHTCKKRRKKEILWECALQWMASKVLSGVFCTKGKRSFVAGWYGFKNITAMGRGLFRFLSLGLELGLTPSKQNRLCHL